jgi:type II secretory pathway component PulF
MLTRIKGGKTFGEAVSLEKHVFTSLQISMITLAEKTGNLEPVSLLLANHLEKHIEHRRRITRGMIYPAILLLMSILLPPLYVAVTKGFAAYLITVMKPICMVLGAVAAVKLISHFQPVFRDRVKLGIPFLGPIVRRISIASFCRVYSITTEAGAGITMIIQSSIDSIPNLFIKSRFQEALSRGMPDEDPLVNIIPILGRYPLVLKMLHTGMETGRVPETMGTASDYLEDEAMTRLNVLLIVLPILTFLGIAVYIGYIVISFWTGHYSTLDGH